MSKIKINLVILGQLPVDLDKTKLMKWKSDIFEIVGPIDHYTITNNSDGKNWEYTDQNIEKMLPVNLTGDFLIAMTHVPLEDNYYARRLSKNRICMTFHEMAEILTISNIPTENLIYKLLYTYTLIYLRHGNRMPTRQERTSFTHDETRGCLFDMNGIKSDIIYSTNNPKLCDSCVQDLKNERVPINTINTVIKEIKQINKQLYFRIVDLIKKHPIRAIVLSTISAIIIGIISSMIYDMLKYVVTYMSARI